MIDKGDIPSIQCKISLRGPKSVRKVNGLSLIFIGFMFQRSRLSSTETSLEIPKNITIFAVCRIYTDVISKQT
jgi:hypothetical protein